MRTNVQIIGVVLNLFVLIGLHLYVNVLDKRSQTNSFILRDPQDLLLVVEAIVRLAVHHLDDFVLLRFIIIIYLLRIRPMRYIQILKAWGFVIVLQSSFQLLLQLVPRKFVAIGQGGDCYFVTHFLPMLKFRLSLETIANCIR